ncbi:hypothetical protein BD410DRAFT_690290, partial [Rickenella mellea]
GGRSITEMNAAKQKLTPAEERVLVDFALESADRGFPLTHRSIENYANNILESKYGEGYEPVGEKW